MEHAWKEQGTSNISKIWNFFLFDMPSCSQVLDIWFGEIYHAEKDKMKTHLMSICHNYQNKESLSSSQIGFQPYIYIYITLGLWQIDPLAQE